MGKSELVGTTKKAFKKATSFLTKIVTANLLLIKKACLLSDVYAATKFWRCPI
jgi:hypothetical protein